MYSTDFPSVSLSMVANSLKQLFVEFVEGQRLYQRTLLRHRCPPQFLPQPTRGNKSRFGSQDYESGLFGQKSFVDQSVCAVDVGGFSKG